MNLSDPKIFDQFNTILTQKTIMTPCFMEPLYLDIVYEIFAADEARLIAYQAVINRTVPGKTVVEIGPGPQLLMTLMCIEAGAKKVYAIERNEQSYMEAKALIAAKGLADRIELIYGFSTEIELPEKVDVCLSELIGCIGGCEGAVPSLNDAKRFLKPDGVMIPERCLTLLSPTTKPAVYQDAFIDEFFATYAQAVYQQVGYEFESPYFEISNFPTANLIATPQVVEDLPFNNGSLATEAEQQLAFSIDQPARFDGLLLWIHLYVSSDKLINSLVESYWNPVYIPMASFQLEAGDQIDVIERTELSANGFHPNYYFTVSIQRQQQSVYHCSKEIPFDYTNKG